MARSLTLPQNFRVTTTAFTDVRLVDTGSGTESLASNVSVATLTAQASYYTPETKVTAADALADFANDARSGRGWILLNGFTLDPLTIDEGTVTFTLHYSRVSALLNADRNSTVRFIMYIVSSTNTNPKWIGTAVTPALTFTTTEQTTPLNVTISETGSPGGGPIFVPAGGRTYLEVYVDAPNVAGVTQHLLHTNAGTSSTRITAFPQFTVQFARTVADTDADAVPDTMTRVYSGARTIADTISTADAITRQFTGARSLADTDADGVTDTLARQFTGARTLTDTDAGGVTDALTRVYNGARTITDTDASGVVDVITRVASFPRALSDIDASGALDAVARQHTALRTLNDTDGNGVLDSLARTFTGARTLADMDPDGVQDTISRQFTGARTLNDIDATGVQDTLSRIATFNRALADVDASGVTDTMARQFGGSRSLVDTDPDGVQDGIARDLIYGRTLLDNLTSGGGGTTFVIPSIIFDD